jgi:hypothetical protein
MWLKLIGLFFGGKSPIDALSDTYIKYKDSAVESERVKAEIAKKQIDATIANAGYQADVIKTGMQHKVFWLVWGIAALPLAAWFAWGTLDTLTNGALPDVATLPPQLKEYADSVWQNVFFTGVAQIVGNAIARRR